MPQLRGSVPTRYGVAAAVFRLEVLSFHRPLKVSVRVAAYLAGADLQAEPPPEPIAVYNETLPAAGAVAVRQATKAQMETVALQQWKATRPDLTGATEEP